MMKPTMGRQGKRGRREYVQVLRLLETVSLAEVTTGVRQALQLRAIAFDAVKHLCFAPSSNGPKLDKKIIRTFRWRGGVDGATDYQATAGDPATDIPQVLLEHYLKQLRLPSILGEHLKTGHT